MPREILAQITSNLSSRECVYCLPSCGDFPLTRKLKTGGITHLSYTSALLPQSAIDFIHSLPLHSFEFSESKPYGVPVAALQMLVDGLSPSLLRLSLRHSSIELLHRDNEPPLDCIIWVPGRTSWIVKDTFPGLLSLKVRLSAAFKTSDALLITEFMVGLPASLTELEVPYLSERVISIWRVLPPLLTQLQTKVAPTAETPMDHLLTLNLDLAPRGFSASEEQERKIAMKSLESWAPPTEEELCLPRHLTDLSLTCSDTRMILTHPSLPRNTLLRLSITSTDSRWNSVDQLFCLIPASVTDLRLAINFECQNYRAAMPTAHELPSVKSFYFQIDEYDDNFEPDLLYSQLLKRLTAVESFEIKSSSCSKSGLSVEHLKMFKKRLVTLTAPLGPDCFPEGDGPYPLETLLPKLTSLTLNSVEWPTQSSDEGHLDLNFAAIPKSVTQLSIETGVSTKYLHQLEASLEPNNGDDWDIDFRQMMHIFQLNDGLPLPLPSSAPFTDSGNMVSNKLTVSSVLSNRFRMKKFSPALTPQTDPLDLERERKCIVADSMLTSPHPPRIPDNLTEMYISSRIRVSQNFIAQHAATLVKLEISQEATVVGTLPLDLFPALRDLQIPGQSGLFGDDYTRPPHLTRLIVRQHIPKSFYPLPASLTVLACQDVSPLDASGLALRSLEVGSKSYEMWSESLPTTLEHLTCHVDWFSTWPAGSISSKLFTLPNLRKLTICGSIPFEMAEILMETPPHIALRVFQLGMQSILSQPAKLALRAQIAPGELSVSIPKESYPINMRYWVKSVYGRLLGQERIDFPLKFPSLGPIDWNAFLPFLPPSTQEIALTSFQVSLGQTVAWPRCLTSITIESLTSNLEPGALPPGLRKLVVLSIGYKGGVADLDAFPETLTHLEITPIPIDFHVRWPPQLIHLAARIRGRSLGDNINSLPPTLEHFRLKESQLPVSLAVHLPVSLKQFRGLCVQSERTQFAQFAAQRGFIWMLRFRDMRKVFGIVKWAPTFDALVEPSEYPNQ